MTVLTSNVTTPRSCSPEPSEMSDWDNTALDEMLAAEIQRLLRNRNIKNPKLKKSEAIAVLRSLPVRLSEETWRLEQYKIPDLKAECKLRRVHVRSNWSKATMIKNLRELSVSANANGVRGEAKARRSGTTQR